MMFDYMIRVLDNGRLLVRNNTDSSSKVLKANEISSYFENVLEAELEAQKEQDAKIEAIKSENNKTYKEWHDDQKEKAEELVAEKVAESNDETES
jgi:predicted GIY-YIG superfamily endonuclease